MIIGITGVAGSGKDTVAKMIQHYMFYKNQPEYESDITILEFLSGQDVYDYCPDQWSINEKLISEDCGWQIKKFATKLKQMCCILTGCTMEQLEDESFKQSLLPRHLQDFHYGFSENPVGISYNRTYRWLLQKLGTEIGREINKDIWVDSLMAEYSEQNWIISDVRFINEVNSIRSRNGIIISVEGRGGISSNHTSETELSKIIPNFTIDNSSTIENTYSQIKQILCQLN